MAEAGDSKPGRHRGNKQAVELLQRARSKRIAKENSLSPPGVAPRQPEHDTDRDISLYARTAPDRKYTPGGSSNARGVVRAQSASPTHGYQGSPADSDWNMAAFKARRASGEADDKVPRASSLPMHQPQTRLGRRSPSAQSPTRQYQPPGHSTGRFVQPRGFLDSVNAGKSPAMLSRPVPASKGKEADSISQNHDDFDSTLDLSSTRLELPSDEELESNSGSLLRGLEKFNRKGERERQQQSTLSKETLQEIQRQRHSAHQAAASAALNAARKLQSTSQRPPDAQRLDPLHNSSSRSVRRFPGMIASRENVKPPYMDRHASSSKQHALGRSSASEVPTRKAMASARGLSPKEQYYPQARQAGSSGEGADDRYHTGSRRARSSYEGYQQYQATTSNSSAYVYNKDRRLPRNEENHVTNVPSASSRSNRRRMPPPPDAVDDPRASQHSSIAHSHSTLRVSHELGQSYHYLRRPEHKAADVLQRFSGPMRKWLDTSRHRLSSAGGTRTETSLNHNREQKAADARNTASSSQSKERPPGYRSPDTTLLNSLNSDVQSGLTAEEQQLWNNIHHEVLSKISSRGERELESDVGPSDESEGQDDSDTFSDLDDDEADELPSTQGSTLNRFGSFSTSGLEIPFSLLELYDNQVLGRGSFGEVFAGRYCNAKVAVKRLFYQEMTQEVINEFKEEVRMLSSMRHPNIVQLLGVCTKTKTPYIIYEYMNGGSLSKVGQSE